MILIQNKMTPLSGMITTAIVPVFNCYFGDPTGTCVPPASGTTAQDTVQRAYILPRRFVFEITENKRSALHYIHHCTTQTVQH